MLRPLALFAAALTLAACSSGPAGKAQAPEATLAMTDWQLQNVGNLHPDPAAFDPSWIRIEGDQVQGNTGCNSLNGSVKIDASSISFGPIATSKRFCSETSAIETAMLGALQEVRKFTLNGERLELLDDNGAALLVFAPKLAAAQPTR